MYILENLNQLEKAANKARTVKPIVRIVSFGVYAVKGATQDYTVECKRNDRGEREVNCQCKGAERGLVCYHSAAALELHCTIAKHRAATH